MNGALFIVVVCGMAVVSAVVFFFLRMISIS
jgi:hypothetical protein